MKNKYLMRSIKQRHNRMSIALVTVIVFFIAIITLFGMFRIKEKKAVYDRQKAYLEEQISEQQQRAIEIEEFAKYTKTKKYAEEVAKEKLGLVKEDEIIFKSESTQ